MKKFFLILALLLMLPVVSAFDVAINSVVLTPSIVAPGQKIDVRILVENQGNTDLEDISVKLDLSSEDLPFAPLQSASEKIIDELDDGEKKAVTFTLSVLSTAESKMYKIPVEISYDDETTDSIIGLQVGSAPKIDVSISDSEIITANAKGKITVKFVNRGLTGIKYLNVELLSSNNHEALSPKTVYIGDLDSDDYETAEFDLYWKSTSNQLPILIEFKDSTNKQYSEQVDLVLKLYTKQEIKQLGLIQYKFPTTAILIIVILVGYFIYRRRKRKKQARL